MPIRVLTASIAILTTLNAINFATAAERPNIVLVMVDDMGFSDIGCYGSEIPTPNLDRLAAGGLRFTQFYNTGRCCPTRAALLTGLYSHQAGVGHMTDDKGPNHPGYRGHLNQRCATIGRLLHEAGYFTAITGKWHVGHRDRSMWPLQRGFDRFYGIPEGGGFYFRVKQDRTVRLGNEIFYSPEKQPPADWYSTDAWVDWGLKFIDDARQTDRPFFLYVAHNAPHFPLQAPPEDIARFRGKYAAGWDALREARYRRQVELGIVKSEWSLSPRPDGVKAWDALSDEERDRFDHIMAIYAAVVSRMDQSIGTLMEGLQQRGVLDNTLVLFLSDNGGTAESGPNGRFAGANPGSADSAVFCGQSWATLQNTPYRRYKRFNHEGGIATPLIAHWPRGIAARGGLREQPGHVIDIVPTCLDVAGAEYPEQLDSHQLTPLVGTSLTPAFADKPLDREALYWEHEGNRALRRGDWKLVALKNGPWELYNLKDDRTELNNLAAQQPDRVAQLSDQWRVWAEQSHVLDKGPKKRKLSN
ncbi:MAG: arylsulfatase [Planctomycetales bacterium]|nr:arylsulfatase [Planctomycetales bacterium]